MRENFKCEGSIQQMNTKSAQLQLFVLQELYVQIRYPQYAPRIQKQFMDNLAVSPTGQ